MQSELVTGHDGNRIHCVHAGTGPAVLIAHGFLLDLASFAGLHAELVARGYRVIAFDQRGHGHSTLGSSGNGSKVAARDYATLIEHFGLRDFTLVGHSMGGFLALVLCLEQPDLARRIKRLVLLGSHAGSVAEGSLQNKLQIALLESGLMPPLWRFAPTGRALVRPLFGRNASAEHVELTRSTLARQDVRACLPLMHAQINESYYARLPEIKVPTRVLCGELDRTCPAWHSRRLGAELPHAETRWLPECGHMLGYEAADAVLDALCSS